MDDPFAPELAVRSIGGHDWATIDDDPQTRALALFAAAQTGVDPDRCCVLVVHLAEGQCWADVAVPTDRHDARAVTTLRGPNPCEFGIVFRRYTSSAPWSPP